MSVESAFEIVFAVGVVGAAAALAGAAFELVGRRALIAAGVAIGVAAVGAWSPSHSTLRPSSQSSGRD